MPRQHLVVGDNIEDIDSILKAEENWYQDIINDMYHRYEPKFETIRIPKALSSADRNAIAHKIDEITEMLTKEYRQWKTIEAHLSEGKKELIVKGKIVRKKAYPQDSATDLKEFVQAELASQGYTDALFRATAIFNYLKSVRDRLDRKVKLMEMMLK